jgi:hypothetical protein
MVFSFLLKTLTACTASATVKGNLLLPGIHEGLLSTSSLLKYKNKWHYLIKTANSAMRFKYNIYVVLMNGKVVPAIIEPAI